MEFIISQICGIVVMAAAIVGMVRLDLKKHENRE